MGISRDHLEKIELKLKTERGWREGLTVNSACGPSGDSNFTPPYSPVCCLPAACRSSFRSSWMPPTTSFLKKKKKKSNGAFSADQREAMVLVFAGTRVQESARLCQVWSCELFLHVVSREDYSSACVSTILLYSAGSSLRRTPVLKFASGIHLLST